MERRSRRRVVDRYVVPRDLRVDGDELEILRDGLCDQQTIERIPMVLRKVGDGQDVIEADVQLADSS